jgi:hypothetical protein
MANSLAPIAAIQCWNYKKWCRFNNARSFSVIDGEMMAL